MTPNQQDRQRLRLAVVQAAVKEVGTVESPPGSNKVKYATWYGLSGFAWCAQFVSWVYDQASRATGVANPLQGMHTQKGFSSTIFGFGAAKRKGLVLGPIERLMLGDIIVWKHTPITGHTGIITKIYDNGSFDVTEGNTSAVDHSSRNGGEVATHRHTRTDGKHGTLLGFIRPTRTFTR